MTRWAAQDDQNRRIMFGSQEQAESFVAANPEWELLSDADPDWKPLPGEPGWSGWPVRSETGELMDAHPEP